MRAVTRTLTHPLDGDIDLDAVAGADGLLHVRDGVGLAGIGAACRVAAGEVEAALAEIERDDTVRQPGTGPVAVGALPFRPGAPGHLIVPRIVVGRGPEGDQWVTVTGANVDADDLAAAQHEIAARVAAAAERRAYAATAAFRVGPGVGEAHYRRAVEAGRDAVRAGELVKVVIARDVLVEADRPLDVAAILRRLRASFGSSYRYLVGGLVGASPELLVARTNRTVRSHPLAGTAPRTGDPATDARLAAELVASTKNQVEHRVVIDAVHDTLLPWCSYLDEEAEPSVITVANVQHLGTAMEGHLSDPPPSALAMAMALSPTPALGGHPRNEALALIERYEGLERGRYGGTVGWVDADGNGVWAVTIRCAEIDGTRARLFAGGGIVAASDPDAELAETQAKLQAMLSAIVRP